MNVPTLPTDNLYKFMATSGIIIMILGIIMGFYGFLEVNFFLYFKKLKSCVTSTL